MLRRSIPLAGKPRLPTSTPERLRLAAEWAAPALTSTALPPVALLRAAPAAAARPPTSRDESVPAPLLQLSTDLLAPAGRRSPESPAALVAAARAPPVAEAAVPPAAAIATAPGGCSAPRTRGGPRACVLAAPMLPRGPSLSVLQIQRSSHSRSDHRVSASGCQNGRLSVGYEARSSATSAPLLPAWPRRPATGFCLSSRRRLLRYHRRETCGIG